MSTPPTLLVGDGTVHSIYWLTVDRIISQSAVVLHWCRNGWYGRLGDLYTTAGAQHTLLGRNISTTIRRRRRDCREHGSFACHLKPNEKGAGMLTRPAGHGAKAEAEARKSEDEAEAQNFFRGRGQTR